MLRGIRDRLTYANVIATMALFVALGGGAYAAMKAPKNSVTSKSIKNGQVKNGDLAKNAVTAAKVKDGSVGSADIGQGAVGAGDIGAGAVGSAAITDGSVAAADLVPDEAYHRVGAPGEPAFSNGNEGDCLWNSASVVFPAFGSVGFYKDSAGIVRLTGIAKSTNGPFGDLTCTTPLSNAEGIEDATIFTLPPGYRPPQLVEIPTVSNGAADAIAIAPDGGADFGSISYPAGAVIVGAGGQTSSLLDGVEFRSAGPGVGLPRIPGDSSEGNVDGGPILPVGG